jgi:hypothetical protein
VKNKLISKQKKNKRKCTLHLHNTLLILCIGICK